MTSATERYQMRPPRLALLCALVLLQACSSSPKRQASTRPPPPLGEGPTVTTTSPARPTTTSQPPVSAKRPGGYYQDDGPGGNPPDLDTIADAVPRTEVLASRANRPYSIFGIQYIPLTQLKPYREKGFASWYGKKFHGQTTSNGERYDMYAMTAAHPTLPLPSYVRVVNPRTGKAVVVRVNDRGPFLHNRIIDLSYTAAAKLGYVNAGSTEVEVTLIDEPEKFAQKNFPTMAAVGGPLPPSPAPLPQTPSAQTSTSPALPSPAASPTAPAPLNGSPASATPGNPPTSSAPISTPDTVKPEPSPEPGLVLTRETLIANQPGAAEPGLYLQLGAFGTKETADATKHRLIQQFPWLSTAAQSKTDYWLKPEAGLFKLHVGPFKSRADALASVERLRTESGLQAFVVAR
jgi:rare lipoprotein A